MYLRFIAVALYALALYSIATYFQDIYLVGYKETLDSYRSIDFDGFLEVKIGIFILLLGVFIFSFLLKGQRLWMLCALLLYFPFYSASWWALSKTMPKVVDGLHDRILKEYSIDDLRRLAKDSGVMIPGVRTENASLVPLSPQELAAVEQLKQKYPFLQWMGGAGLQNSGSETQVHWKAGSFYWGISIDTGGRYNQDGWRGRDPMVHTIHISDDIYLYSIGY